jgi:hypothetical protein
LRLELIEQHRREIDRAPFSRFGLALLDGQHPSLEVDRSPAEVSELADPQPRENKRCELSPVVAGGVE